MERETKTFDTPGKHKIVIYTYATGREAKEIEQVLMKAMKVDMSSAKDFNIKEIDTSAPFEAEKLLITKLVVSVDGNKENVVESLLDLPQSEYQFVVDEANEITKKK